MKSISNIDSNFKVETDLKKEDIKFYNSTEAPFQVYGVFMENGKYRRLPEKIAASVSEGVYALHTNTAGGRVRFKTDSQYVAVSAKMDYIGKMPHFPLTGSAGFDLYSKEGQEERYVRTFVPPFDIENGYEGIIEFETKKLREITINFPLYSNVNELYIGLDGKSTVGEAEAYKNPRPIVYYGSSITQGGCASRPGNTYQGFISRRFDCDYINLGFSGNARAEEAIIEYIKTLDMSVFVYDYDHNAPSAEYLMSTHNKMFKAIRRAKPDIPVVIMSRPKYYLTSEEKERLAVIEKTFTEALAEGDKRVFLLNGETLMRECKAEGTVDDCHPNDLGFMSMARALESLIEEKGLLCQR